MSTTDENRRLIEKLFEMQASGDMEGVAAIYDPAYTHYIAGSTPVSGKTTGFEELGQKLAPVMELLDGPVEVDLIDMVADDTSVVVLCHGSGKGKTGLPYNNEYVFWYTIRNGKIVESKEFGDTALVETALFGKVLVEPS